MYQANWTQWQTLNRGCSTTAESGKLTCLLLNLPAPQIRKLAPGPRGVALGCPDNKLDNLHGLRLFTLPLYPGCTEQSILRPGRHHISCASLESTALVPPLLGLLVDHPVLLPSTRHLLADPASPQNIHPMFHLLHLAVFHISGDSTRQWDFLTTLPRFSLQQLTPQHRKLINQRGDARVASVIDERSILFLQH